MSDQRNLARRAILEAAILTELHAAADDTREALRAQMRPGDRITADDDLGAAQVTRPRRTTKVVDWPAFQRWVETHAPEAIVTTTQINPAFVSAVCRSGEYVTPDGEVLTPDGVGTVEGTPQLRITPTDAAHEQARTLLGALRALEIEP